ncbi:MAG: hypothetical protein AABW80_00670 [Nanoarchaeota archaeon]
MDSIRRVKGLISLLGLTAIIAGVFTFVPQKGLPLKKRWLKKFIKR